MVSGPNSRCVHHRLVAEVVELLRAGVAVGELGSRALSHVPCDVDAHRFAVVDCEATSGDHRRAELLEAAVVALAGDGTLVGVDSALVTGAPAFNSEVHNIDDELLSMGRPAREVADMLVSALHGRVLVAFRPELDIALLDRFLRRFALSVTVPYVVCLADHAPLLGSSAVSLAGLAADCGLVNMWPHRAAGDALTEAAILARLLQTGLVDSTSVMVPWRGCGPWTLGGS